MSALHADLDGLLALTERLVGLQRRIETLASELDGQVCALHDQWSGAAAAAHLQAHRQWREGAERMRAAADELRGFVRCAHVNYSTAVAANARMWS